MRSPLVAALIAATLAVGLAGILVVVAVADAVFGRPLPYDRDEELVLAFSSDPEAKKNYLATSRPNYEDWRSSARALDLEAVSLSRTFSLTGVENPRPVNGEYVSPGYFRLLGLDVTAGRLFDDDDDRPGAPLVVLLSRRLSQQLFGSDDNAIGSHLRLADRVFEVVGVLESAYRGILWDPVDLWVPLDSAAEILGERFRSDRDMDWHLVVGRLRPGFTSDQADSELDALAARLEERYPDANHGKRAHVESLRSFYFRGELKRGLTYLGAASLLVLLLVTANVAILALGQSSDSAREVAVQRALGAPPSRLLATLAAPLVVPLGLGLLSAFTIAWLLTPRLVALSDIPPATLTTRWVDARLALVGLLMVLAIGLAVTILTYLTHGRRPLDVTLRSSGTMGAGPLRTLERLIVAETTIAVVLLVTTGLLLASLANLRSSDPGFGIEGIGVLRVDLQPSRYDDPSTQRRFVEALLDSPPPGFDEAAVSGPRIAPSANRSAELLPEGTSSDTERFDVYRQSITPGFLDTIGLTLVEGRAFGAGDHDRAQRVALVSATTAQRLGGETAVGRRFRLRPELPGDPVWTVVGVLQDVAARGLTVNPGAEPDVYLPFAQAPERSFFLLARSAGLRAPSLSRLRPLEESVRRLDSELPLSPPTTLADRYSVLTADQGFHTAIATCFSIVAWSLTLLGLFGVIDLSVRARRRELALRIAVGAPAHRLTREAIFRALRLASTGLVAGLALTLLARRALQSMLFGVAPYDPVVLISASALVLLSAVFAVTVPALRIRRVDATAELARGR